MNAKLAEFQIFLKNRRIAVLGAGISNRPLIRYLARSNSDITVFDRMESSNPEMIQIKEELARDHGQIQWITGKDYLSQLTGYDVIFKTPIIRHDIPELISERKRGCVITSEMEVFLQLCPCMTLGITGSDGKTTTTTLAGLLLEREGYTVHVGGNIGRPLLSEIDRIMPNDFAVVELSSFQLHSMRTSPNRALVTNISRNHLDVHKNYREYIHAKTSIFKYQNFLGKLYLNAEDEISKRFAKQARGTVDWFLRKEPQGFYYDEKTLFLGRFNPVKREEILLRGSHNLKNICAAVSMVSDLISEETLREVVQSFKGVEHRNEYLTTVGEIPFYNSSIDSSPGRTIATLNTYIDEGISLVVILGGKDKNSDYSGLGEALLKASRKIILCGQNASLILASINQALKENPEWSCPEIREVSCYEDAVREAYRLASEGDTVLLTPAGTSFDRYKNFEERGLAYKRAVEQLIR
jgi:UDP-N-acetylmuramoylalanine--D-glutamate ligase